MNNIVIVIMIVILFAWIFYVTFALIDSVKQINKLFDEFYKLELRFDRLRDFYFELNSNINKAQKNIDKAKKEINQIKGQMFIVIEKGAE